MADCCCAASLHVVEQSWQKCWSSSDILVCMNLQEVMAGVIDVYMRRIEGEFAKRANLSKPSSKGRWQL